MKVAELNYKYECTNCQVSFPDVNAYFAHALDCKMKYHLKPRYRKVAINRIKEAPVPNRYTVSQHDMIYKFLVELDGEECYHCGKITSPEAPLEVDHLDGNRYNSKPENLHLLCKSCNLQFRALSTTEKVHIFEIDSARRVRGGGRGRDSTRVLKLLVDRSSASAEMQVNALAETRFRDWILGYLSAHLWITRDDAIYGGAEYVGCSPKTTEKYLKKMVSITGPLETKTNEFGQIMIVRRTMHA